MIVMNKSPLEAKKKVKEFSKKSPEGQKEGMT